MTIKESLSLVKKYCPTLAHLRATLVPFEDVIIEHFAGPQDDDTDEPWFSVSVSDPRYPKSEINFRFTRDEITMEQIQWIKREPVLADDPCEVSMEDVHNFLRQLPRPVTSFCHPRS
jgi:hypothetical protein